MFVQTLPTPTGTTAKVQATATTSTKATAPSMSMGDMTMGAGGEMNMDWGMAWADDGWGMNMSWGDNFMGNSGSTTGAVITPLVNFPPAVSDVYPYPYTPANTGAGAGATQENNGDEWLIQNDWGGADGTGTQENYWDNGDSTVLQGGDALQPGQEALVLRVNEADYTLETSNASLVMNALDNTITVTPAGTQSHIDGGAGSDSLILPGASSQFFVQTMPDGSSAIFDQTGVFNLVATNVEQAVFTDKTVALATAVTVPEDDLPTDDPFGDITFGDDDFFSQTPDALVVSQWMQNPFAPFPTAQFVDLVFERVFQQELGTEEAQYWNNWVYDYIQEPGQFAHLTGLINEYSEALFV
ncbi:MAG: hypothetical protein PHF42_09545 [Pseudomonas sp.]|nr:hypothetical protein [Pseudomonas sp.]